MRTKIVVTVIITTIFAIVALIIIYTTFFEGDNQCEYNGVKYNEFAKHPVEDCQCRGRGDGYENASWVCRGGE